MPLTPQQAFQDTRFRALPASDQRAILGKLDPGFGALSEPDQLGVLQQGMQRFAPANLAAPPVASPGQIPNIPPALGQYLHGIQGGPAVPQPAPSNPSEGAPSPMMSAIGKYVPQGATPALSYLNDTIVQPFEHMASAGAEAGSAIAESAVAANTGGPLGTSVPSFEASHPLIAGMSQALGKVAGSTIADPRNWPLLGMGGATVRPLLARVISGGFGAMMGAQTIGAAKQLVDNWDKMTPQQRAEEITATGLTAVMTAASAMHAASSHAEPVTTESPALPFSSPSGKIVRERLTPNTPVIPESASPGAATPENVTAAQTEGSGVQPDDTQVVARPSAPTPPSQSAIDSTGAKTQNTNASATPATPKPVASMQAIETKGDSVQLRELGYPQPIIDKLEPQQVQTIIRQNYRYSDLSSKTPDTATTQASSIVEAPSTSPSQFPKINDAIDYGKKTYGPGNFKIDPSGDGEHVVSPKGNSPDLAKVISQATDLQDKNTAYFAKSEQLVRNPNSSPDIRLAVSKEEFISRNALRDKFRLFSQSAPADLVEKQFELRRQDAINSAEEVAKIHDLSRNFEVASTISAKLHDPNLTYDQRVSLNRLLGNTQEVTEYRPLRYIPDGPPGSKGERLGLEVQDKIAQARSEIRAILEDKESLPPALAKRFQSYLDNELPVIKAKRFVQPAKGPNFSTASDHPIFKKPNLANIREALGSARTKMGTLGKDDQAKLDNFKAQIKEARYNNDKTGVADLTATMQDFQKKKMLEFLNKEAQIRQDALQRHTELANAMGSGIRRTVNADVQAVIDAHAAKWDAIRDKYLLAPRVKEAQAPERAPIAGELPAGDAAAIRASKTIEALAPAVSISPEQQAAYENNTKFLQEGLPSRRDAVQALRSQLAKPDLNFLARQKLEAQLEDALAKEHMALRRQVKIQADPYADSKSTAYEKAESRILSSEVLSDKLKAEHLAKLRNDYPNEAIAASKTDAHQKTLDAIRSAYSKPLGKGLASPNFPRDASARSPEAGYASMPLLTAPVDALSKAWKATRDWADPDKQLSVNDVAKGTLREAMGGLARESAMLAHEMQPYVDAWDKQSPGQSIDFINRMERGLPQTTAVDQGIANALRGLLDERRDAIAGLDIGIFEAASKEKMDAYLRKIVAETDPATKAKMVAKMSTVARGYIENYFPHIWDKDSVFTRQAPQMMHDLEMQMGQSLKGKPMQGSADFLKNREHELFMDGITRGLVPVTYNPVKLAMIRVGEMDRYIKAWQVFQDYDARGMLTADEDKAKLLGYGADKLDRRIFSKDVWAHPRVANVLNNYLAPGLWSSQISFENPLKSGHQIDIPWYRTLRNSANLLNLSQLGLSAFHFTTTSVNMMVSDLGLAMQRLTHGEVEKAVPAGLRAILAPASAIRGFIEGGKGIEEYLQPGSHPGLAPYAKAMEIANFRPVMDAKSRAMQTEAFDRNIKTAINDQLSAGQRMSAGAKLPANLAGKVLEKLSAPLMDHYVPRLKVAAFMDQTKYVLDRLGPNVPDEVLRKELGKVADSIDNRFGQLNYDNLNWHRVARDMSMVLMRAPGWSIGTIRELGGGVGADLPKALGSLVTGQRPELTARMAYTTALAVQVGYLSAAYMYLHTGQFPKTITDYFYPKNGQKNAEGEDQRSNITSYMREVFGAEHDWKSWATNKLSPTIQLAEELWRNKDFYNVEITHPDDPKLNQFGQAMTHVLGAFLPFSVRNASEAHRLGASPQQSGERFFGINPAPSWAGRTPMEQKLAEFAGVDHQSVAGRTQQAFEQAQNKGALRAKGAGMNEVMAAVQADKISENDAEDLLNSKGEPFVERNFKGITAGQALSLWNLANANERRTIAPLMAGKLISAQTTETKGSAAILSRRYAEAGISNPFPKQ